MSNIIYCKINDNGVRLNVEMMDNNNNRNLLRTTVQKKNYKLIHNPLSMTCKGNDGSSPSAEHFEIGLGNRHSKHSSVKPIQSLKWVVICLHLEYYIRNNVAMPLPLPILGFELWLFSNWKRIYRILMTYEMIWNFFFMVSPGPHAACHIINIWCTY